MKKLNPVLYVVLINWILEARYSILDAGCSILDNLHLRNRQNVIEYRESRIEYQPLPAPSSQLPMTRTQD
jgi:hypothetical protein